MLGISSIKLENKFDLETLAQCTVYKLLVPLKYKVMAILFTAVKASCFQDNGPCIHGSFPLEIFDEWRKSIDTTRERISPYGLGEAIPEAI